MLHLTLFQYTFADHRDSVSSLAFSSDGQLLASGSFDKLVQVWDINSDRKSTLEGPAGGIEVKVLHSAVVIDVSFFFSFSCSFFFSRDIWCIRF